MAVKLRCDSFSNVFLSPQRLLIQYFFIFLLCILYSQNTLAWWNENWRYRKPIDIAIPTELRDSAPLQTIPVRLHTANFPYFYNIAEGGADIRLVGQDDLTPLPFHIETLDIVSGIGLLWVQLPENLGNGEKYRIWIYYDNPNAVTNADSTATFDPAIVAAYHFSEKISMPRDSTAYAHHVLSYSARNAVEGYHDNGLGLVADSTMKLPESPAFTMLPEKGISIESWVKFEEDGAFVVYGNSNERWQLDIIEKTPTISIISGDNSTLFQATKNLIPGHWHHVGFSWKDTLTMLIDGEVVLTESISLPQIQGSYALGASADTTTMTGVVDELRIFSQARHDNWFNFSHAIQDSSSILYEYLPDQQQESAPGSEILASLWPLLNNIGLAGWLVIIILGVLGLAAADVMLTKLYFLSRMQKANDTFRSDCKDNHHGDLIEAIEHDGFNHSHSPYWRILDSAKQAAKLTPRDQGQDTGLYVEAIRSSLDEALLEETNRLNSHMVWINIAVSGGPFLGLLGTVIGVMITFATIAQSGDVNVNTIAPGVAAALTTTVLGLIVAIPALFGYNFLAGKLGRVIAELETFADKLAVLIALKSTDNTQAVNNA